MPQNGTLGMIGSTLLGSGMGMLSADLQQKRNKENMDYQAKLNEQAAEATQKRNMEMWDYTNYENQMKHIKAAGLNPALLYGQSGGGGVSAQGGQGFGVGMAQDQSGQLAMQGAGMGLQAMQLQKSMELTDSQIDLNNAEADKTRGVDTDKLRQEIEESKGNVDKLVADTKNADARTALTNQQYETELFNTSLTNQKFQNAQKEFDLIEYQAKKAKVEADNWEPFMKTQINNLNKQASLYLSQMKVNNMQQHEIMQSLCYKWDIEGKKVTIQEKWNDIQEELGKLGIDVSNKKMVVDGISSILNTVSHIVMYKNMMGGKQGEYYKPSGTPVNITTKNVNVR